MIKIAILLYAMWIGGLATTVYNRVPNDIPIGPSQKPRCNECKKEIKFKYFFPVIGYLLSKGKCVNCGMKIPKVYPLLELSILSYILILSTTFDTFDEQFISKSLYGAFMIVLLFIYKSYKQFKMSLIWMLIFFILTYRGYNYCLPDIVVLFISVVMCFLSFSIISKIIPMDIYEFATCVVLSASLGVVFSICILCGVIILKSIYSFSTFEKIRIITKTHIVYLPLLTAIIMTFFV